ncbi:hypothetical protein Vretimale_11269 [Volvox reticuliferus]|uniref:Uncharacterized protein n=1 Tax=Volvox reticuliferus TaxID=1737510 RepID=A0A8J4GHX5_9CHLO|nr:hypothetical protein Vretifemale_12080 [Volvox reticuliferus]GIM07186.1 hypothetical protein Vretimale_11269 [Volvox reticuliferus]
MQSCVFWYQNLEMHSRKEEARQPSSANGNSASPHRKRQQRSSPVIVMRKPCAAFPSFPSSSPSPLLLPLSPPPPPVFTARGSHPNPTLNPSSTLNPQLAHPGQWIDSCHLLLSHAEWHTQRPSLEAVRQLGLMAGRDKGLVSVGGLNELFVQAVPASREVRQERYT